MAKVVVHPLDRAIDGSRPIYRDAIACRTCRRMESAGWRRALPDLAVAGHLVAPLRIAGRAQRSRRLRSRRTGWPCAVVSHQVPEPRADPAADGRWRNLLGIRHRSLASRHGAAGWRSAGLPACRIERGRRLGPSRTVGGQSRRALRGGAGPTRPPPAAELHRRAGPNCWRILLRYLGGLPCNAFAESPQALRQMERKFIDSGRPLPLPGATSRGGTGRALAEFRGPPRAARYAWPCGLLFVAPLCRFPRRGDGMDAPPVAAGILLDGTRRRARAAEYHLLGRSAVYCYQVACARPGPGFSWQIATLMVLKDAIGAAATVFSTSSGRRTV